MEPPYWYYPVRQTLGAVLMQQGRPEDAKVVFERALQDSPRNGWALWGLLQTQTAAGDERQAATRSAFGKASLGDPRLLTLEGL